MNNLPLNTAKVNALLHSGLATIGISIHAGALRSGVSRAKRCRLSFKAFACCTLKNNNHLNETLRQILFWFGHKSKLGLRYGQACESVFFQALVQNKAHF